MGVFPKDFLVHPSCVNSFVFEYCADLTSSNIIFQVSDVVHQWSDGLPELGQPRNTRRIPSRRVPRTSFAGCGSHRHLPYFLSIPATRGFSSVLVNPSSQAFPHQTINLPLPFIIGPQKHSLSRKSASLPTSGPWRAGFQLFDPFLASDTLILQQIVGTLGRFPELWWSSWEAREQWFDETGNVKPEAKLIAEKSSLREKLRDIGQQDDPPEVDEGRMIEKTGTGIEEAEVELLTDLLEKMLRYNPETRISLTESYSIRGLHTTDYAEVLDCDWMQ